MKIYLASSWRNQHYAATLELLRYLGAEVYDFKQDGFSWSDIDPRWQEWSPEAYKAALQHPVAIAGHKKGKDAMIAADVCVMVLPSGRSASFELGYMMGLGKVGLVFQPEKDEANLMYRDATICCSRRELSFEIGVLFANERNTGRFLGEAVIR
jgi:nucleoside 2-deoxyribosyltransferase